MMERLRFWRVKRQGYKAGRLGIPHDAVSNVPHDDRVAWIVGWQNGHCDWMMER